MKTRYSNTATITTLVGGNIVESQRHIATTRKPLTYIGARRVLKRNGVRFVDVVRLESMAVAVR